MSGNWRYLIKGPPSQQSVKAFKKQMQIGSAATKDTEEKRLKEYHLRTIFFYLNQQTEREFPHKSILRQLLFIIYANKILPRTGIRSESVTFTDNTHVNF